jgi:pyrroloquinoline quinone biosynthesis protein E
MTDPPLGMLAELTHRCPLHCPYCSNPVELAARSAELSTPDWLTVLDQAAALGVLQVHFSGGEPLARPDLPELVARARRLGCYTNLVTSGLGLSEAVADELVRSGVDHVQLSVQDADPDEADRVAGTRAHQLKRRAADVVNRAGLPLSVNVVLHRHNIARVGAIVELAEQLGADRLELANVQYYGWALRNRAALMPTREQLAAAEPEVRAAKERLSGRMDVVHVVADYHDAHPKPCNYGWGSRQLTVAPNGDVLPCPAATAIPDLEVSNVRQASLAEIWYDSPSFNAFRGTEWMQEPCRSCSRKTVDLGGCRCQAYLLTGDAAATDPVCSLSPHRGLVDAVLAEESGADRPLVMRTVSR